MKKASVRPSGKKPTAKQLAQREWRVNRGKLTRVQINLRLMARRLGTNLPIEVMAYINHLQQLNDRKAVTQGVNLTPKGGTTNG